MRSQLVSHLYPEALLALLDSCVSPCDVLATLAGTFLNSHFFHFPVFLIECSYGVLSDCGNC